MYEYPGRVVDIHDGDTFTAVVDLGFHVTVREKFRLAQIQAPELTGESRERGKRARDYFVGLIGGVGATVTIRTFRDRTEKYGRYLAAIILADGRNVAHEMVLHGHAVFWDGTGPRPAALREGESEGTCHPISEVQ